MNASITAIEASNSLADLAARIRTYHEATVEALKHSVEHAMSAGDCLIEAKVKHGEWLPWLQDHCRITERTAQRYMRLSRNRGTIEAKYDIMSDLTINSALALLTIPREPLDDNLVESVVLTLDTADELAESLRSQAEIARRRVLLDATEQNHQAIDKLFEKLCTPRGPIAPNDFDAVEAELGLDVGFVGHSGEAYEAAVASDDYESAFALAEWLHGCSAKMRKFMEECAAAAAAGESKADKSFAEWFTSELGDVLTRYCYPPEAA